MKGKYWQGLVNPLIAAQNFEYKISSTFNLLPARAKTAS